MPLDPLPAWFTDAVSFACQKRDLTVAGCTLRYLVWGDPDKPPLVLVHGGAAHAMWWSIHACELSRNYYVIAPDLSGHGDSGRRETYPIEAWAEEGMAVGEDAAAGRAPVLVGHSMGGLVSIVAPPLSGAEKLPGAVILHPPLRPPPPQTVTTK